MKVFKILTISALFLAFLTQKPLFTDPRVCQGNDTVVMCQEETKNLMNYLRGTWSLSGSWQIVEGHGKIKKVIKTRILGTESFEPILEGHFLQKKLTAKIKYHSRDLDKLVQMPFSALTLFTFNNNLNKYYYWFYDSTGAFLDAGGKFNHDQNQYTFISTFINEKGMEVESMQTFTIVDDDHYRWEAKERLKDTETWSPTATGLSTRKRK